MPIAAGTGRAEDAGGGHDAGARLKRALHLLLSLLALALRLVAILVGGVLITRASWVLYLFGAFLLWIPVVALLLAAGLVAGVLRPYLQKRG